MATRTRSLMNRKAVMEFIKESGKHITQVESTFHTALEQELKHMILRAIAKNASSHRLTQYELLGATNSNKETQISASKPLS